MQLLLIVNFGCILAFDISGAAFINTSTGFLKDNCSDTNAKILLASALGVQKSVVAFQNNGLKWKLEIVTNLSMEAYSVRDNQTKMCDSARFTVEIPIGTISKVENCSEIVNCSTTLEIPYQVVFATQRSVEPQNCSTIIHETDQLKKKTWHIWVITLESLALIGILVVFVNNRRIGKYSAPVTTNQSINQTPTGRTSTKIVSPKYVVTHKPKPETSHPQCENVRESALIVDRPDRTNSTITKSYQDTQKSTMVSNLSTSVSAGQNSSTINSVGPLFEKANKYEPRSENTALPSVEGVQTLSETVQTGSPNKMNSRAEKMSDSQPQPIEELPIHILKHIWRMKIREEKGYT